MNALVPGGLFLIAASLAAILVYQSTAPVASIETHQIVAEPHIVPLSASLPRYEPPPPDAFAMINARPLFSPSREAVVEAAETGTTSRQPPDVSLVGVAIGMNKSVALLKSPNAQAATSAVVGQVIDGWRLMRIDPDKVVFAANGTEYTVKIRAAAGTTPILPPAPPAATHP
ncbi:MAG TPA: hypothetical protein VGF56_00805 [Rhizomicrobium sp.]|jgi:hypothetical protein